MTGNSTTTPAPTARGRGYLWAAIALSVLGIGLAVLQYSLKQLMVPWYVPILTTVGVLLLFIALAKRRSITRVAVLILLLALAGIEWLFLLSLSRLPGYDGPAQPGRPMPAFETTLADGRPFTNKDLHDGTPRVFLFFRGRW